MFPKRVSIAALVGSVLIASIVVALAGYQWGWHSKAAEIAREGV